MHTLWYACILPKPPVSQPLSACLYQHDVIEVTDQWDVLCNQEGWNSLDYLMTEDGRLNITLGKNYK